MSDSKSAPAPDRGRRLEVEVEGYDKPFAFDVTLGDFQGFQREAQRDAAMATNNFLLRTCTEQSRLKTAMAEHWGLSGLLMEPIAAELVDLRAVHLKNSRGA